MVNPRSIIEAVCAEVLKPRVILSVEEWADQNRMLTETSAEQGHYKTRRTPYLAEPMRSCTDRSVQRVVLMFASQTGKTELLFNVIGHAACERPRPALYAISTHALAQEYSKTRLGPAINASRTWSEHALEIGVKKITFDRMHLALVGAHATGNLKGRPVGLLLCDEIDEWPAGHLAIARERTKTFADRLELDASTPSNAGVGIDAEYDNSDKRTYYVPCPHCETHHKLEFKNLTWDKLPDGSQPDSDVADATVCMVCPECGCEIHHDLHKQQMIRRGVWLPDGERPAGPRDEVTREAVAYDGTPVPVTGKPKRPHSMVRGYQLSALYSPFTTFGEVARAFAEDGYRLTPGFVNGWLGEAWKAVRDSIKRSALDVLKVHRRHGGYLLGSVPEACPVLITTIDVQSEHCYLMTVGFGAGKRAMAIVDWREIAAPEGDRLTQLDDVVAKLAYPCAGRIVRPIAVGIDTGHRAGEAYSFVRRMRAAGFDAAGRRVVPLKGDATPGVSQGWRELRCENYPGTKTKMPPELQLRGILVNTDLHKSDLHGVIKQSIQGQTALLAPEDAPTEVLDGLVSEQRVTETKRGMKVMVWKQRSGRLGEFNHPLDLMVYAMAMADFERMELLTEADIKTALARSEQA